MNTFKNEREMEKTLKYFKSIGEVNAKTIVSKLSFQVIKYTEVNEEIRSK